MIIKKIIAYDDSTILLKTLDGVFGALKADYKLVASFPDAAHILDHITTYQPDLVLLDIEMRDDDEDGLVALFAIKKEFPDQKVMMLTTFDNDDKVFNAICLGADGYMLKTDFADNLPHVIMLRSLNIIFSGGAYLTPAVAKKILHLFRDTSIGTKIGKVMERFSTLFHQSKNPTQQNMDYKLTKTQQLILEELATGKTAVLIAKEKNVTENTVYTHIKAIYRELEVHTRGEAIRKAFEERLIKLNT